MLQFEWQWKFSALRRHMIVVPQSPSLNICQAPSESPWTLDLWCHMSPQQLGGIDTCGPGVHMYFLVLSSSACAAAPGSVAALWQCDWQKVLTHVASHIRYFPRSQGTMVIPSGCFPSAWCNPEGSSREGIIIINNTSRGSPPLASFHWSGTPAVTSFLWWHFHNNNSGSYHDAGTVHTSRYCTDMVNRIPIPGLMECKASGYA